jgi:hypothetical protein
MSPLRRRRLPEDLKAPQRAFVAMLGEVERAKAALTDVMPTTRLPGRPLPDALWEFEDHLARAHVLMPTWRVPQTQAVWSACEAGVVEARERARRLREEAPDLGGFEGLIWAVEQLMDPLAVFEGAVQRFDELRV